MGLYMIGFLFTYGIIYDDKHDNNKWYVILFCCLVWPITLGSIVGNIINRFFNTIENKEEANDKL